MDLVLAICHEIGNHLAAARLGTRLLATASQASERRVGLGSLEAALAHAGALLSQISALLTRSGRQSLRIRLAPLLEAVGRELAGLGPQGARIALRVPRRAPDVRANPALLHAVLVALVLEASEAAGTAGHVSVSVIPERSHVRVRVEDDGPPPEDLRPAPSSPPPHGRALVVKAAEAALRGSRGRILLRRTRGNTRIELVLPAADRVRRRARAATQPSPSPS